MTPERVVHVPLLLTMDPALGEELLGLIDEIADIFWQTEKAKGMGVYPPA